MMPKIKYPLTSMTTFMSQAIFWQSSSFFIDSRNSKEALYERH